MFMYVYMHVCVCAYACVYVHTLCVCFPIFQFPCVLKKVLVSMSTDNVYFVLVTRDNCIFPSLL